jgi:hypothetical protein
VVVLCGWFDLVMVVVFVKMKLFNKIQLFEFLKVAVDSGKTQMRYLEAGAVVYFIGVKVTLPLTNYLQNCSP